MPEKSAPNPEPRATQASAAASALEPPPGPPGEWLDSLRYRLRVMDVRPCDAEPSGGFRLGVRVEVAATDQAGVSPVVASPKAATLEKDGKVFSAQLNPRLTPACEHPLKLERLAPGHSARGVLVFEAPNESYLRSAVFRFQPPRWGGEAPILVTLPDCFGESCPEPAE